MVSQVHSSPGQNFEQVNVHFIGVVFPFTVIGFQVIELLEAVETSTEKAWSEKKRYRVTSAKLAVRESPSASSDVLCFLSKECVVQQANSPNLKSVKSEKWAKIVSGQHKGWVILKDCTLLDLHIFELDATSSEKGELADHTKLPVETQSKILSCLVPSLVTVMAQSSDVEATALTILLVIFEFGTSSHLETVARVNVSTVPTIVSLLAKVCQLDNDPHVQKDAVHIVLFAMIKGWADYSQQLLRNGLLPQITRIANGTGIIEKEQPKSRGQSSNKALDSVLKKLSAQIPPDEFLAAISALLHFVGQQNLDSSMHDDDSSEGSPHGGPRLFHHEDQGVPTQLDSILSLRRHCEAMGFSFPFTLQMEDDDEEEEEEEGINTKPLEETDNSSQPVAAPQQSNKSSRKRRHGHADQNAFPFAFTSSGGHEIKRTKPIQGAVGEADIAGESNGVNDVKSHLQVGVLDPVYSQNIGIHGKLGHMCMEAIGFAFQEGDSPSFVFHDSYTLQTQLNNKRILVAASGIKSLLATEQCCTIEKKLRSLSELLQLAKRVEEVHRSLSVSDGLVVDEHPIHQALRKICDTLEGATQEVKISPEEVQPVIHNLKTLLLAPEGITGYEIQASGLADVLVRYLSCGLSNDEQVLSTRLQRLVMFGQTMGLDQAAGNKLAVLLQNQLSQAEQLQVILYDEISGLGSGFQALRHPIQLKFVCADSSDEKLKELAEPSILVEPTATGQDIRSWLQSRVEKKWYESERASIHFIKLAMQSVTDPHVKHVKMGANDGILHWIGTNAGKVKWTNPAKCEMISASSSSGATVHGLFDSSGCELGVPGYEWVGFDLGISIAVSAYSFKCRSGLAEGWSLIASSTGCEKDWFLLKAEGESPRTLTGEAIKYPLSRKQAGSSRELKRQSTHQSKKQATRATQSRANKSQETIHTPQVHDTKSRKSSAPKEANCTSKCPSADMSNRTRSQVVNNNKLPDVPKVVRITRSNAGMLTQPEVAAAVRTKDDTEIPCAKDKQVSRKRHRGSKADFCTPDLVIEKNEEVPKSFRFFKLVSTTTSNQSIRASDLEIFASDICDGSISKLSCPGVQPDRPDTNSMIWEWNDGDAWTPYDTRTAARLELACRKEESKVHLTTGYFSTRGGYVVDLQKKVQINLRTGNHRSVRRRKASQQSSGKHKSSLLKMRCPSMEAASLFSSHMQDSLGPSPVLRRDFSALAPSFDNDPHRAHSNPTQTLPVLVRAGDAEDADTPVSSVTADPLFLYVSCAEKSNQSNAGGTIELGDKKTILHTLQESYAKEISDGKTQKRDRGKLPIIGKPSWVNQLWKASHTIYYSSTGPVLETGPVKQMEVAHSKCGAVCASSPPCVDGSVQNILFLLHLLWGSGCVNAQKLVCECLTNKLKQQMEDVLSLCCGTVPPWCATLIRYNPRFFGQEARLDLFASRSLGFSRTVSRWDQQTNHNNNSHSLRWRQQRVGHLVTERVIVPRDEQHFFNAAEQAMRLHAKRRTVLDFAFEAEEGTGVGPTAEFYTLASIGFRITCASMWRDVNSETGLFPALLPQNKKDAAVILQKWEFFGRFLARALLDNRIVDMHLSTSFCQLLCGQQLTLDDVKDADPGLKLLMELKGEEIEAVCQTMSWEGRDLIAGGCDIDVNDTNIDDFRIRAASFVLFDGIKDQMAVFRTGFEEACPLDSLHALTAQELCVQLTGDGSVDWTLGHLRNMIEPKHGYTIESPAFLMFLDVLVEMSDDERKNFVWWATGSPRLPPGGLEKLSPHKLSVVLKTDGDQHCDDIMLSVNVCNKAIKLPAYTTKEILRQRLSAAINTKEAREFHLN